MPIVPISWAEFCQQNGMGDPTPAPAQQPKPAHGPVIGTLKRAPGSAPAAPAASAGAGAGSGAGASAGSGSSSASKKRKKAAGDEEFKEPRAKRRRIEDLPENQVLYRRAASPVCLQPLIRRSCMRVPALPCPALQIWRGPCGKVYARKSSKSIVKHRHECAICLAALGPPPQPQPRAAPRASSAAAGGGGGQAPMEEGGDTDEEN